MFVCLALFLVQLRESAAQSGAGADFQTAFEKLLKHSTNELISPTRDELWDDVLKRGSREEVKIAIWRVLNEPSQKSDWANAIGLAYSAAIPIKDMTNWARSNLASVVTVRSEKLQQAIVTFLSGHGDRSDAARIRELANQLPPDQADLASFHRKTADMIESQIEFSEIYPWTKNKGESAKTSPQSTSERSSVRSIPNPATTFPKDNLTSGVTIEPTTRKWFVWLLVVIVATGGAVWLFLRKSSK